MGEDLVQPHERPVEVHLDPARSASHILAVVLRPPPFNKAHANRAHLCELKNSFKSLINTLGQQLGKVLVVEDLQRTSWRYLADGSRMKMMRVIAVTTLDKDGSIAKTLGKHLSSNVEQVDTFTNVSTNILNG